MCYCKKQNLSLNPSLIPVSVGINMYIIQQIHNSCQLYIMLLSQNLRERRGCYLRILMETAATPSFATNKPTSIMLHEKDIKVAKSRT